MLSFLFQIRIPQGKWGKRDDWANHARLALAEEIKNNQELWGKEKDDEGALHIHRDTMVNVW